MSDATKDAAPLSDAEIKACALMIKGICMTRPQEEWSANIESRIRFMLSRAPAQVQAEAMQVDSIARLAAFHAEQLEANPYCYFELAYTRQTDWMAWITDRPAQGEPGTAAYAKSRKVIVRGQGATAEEACADALAALAAPSTGDQ